MVETHAVAAALRDRSRFYCHHKLMEGGDTRAEQRTERSWWCLQHDSSFQVHLSVSNDSHWTIRTTRRVIVDPLALITLLSLFLSHITFLHGKVILTGGIVCLCLT